jgi:hypothetical protein
MMIRRAGSASLMTPCRPRTAHNGIVPARLRSLMNGPGMPWPDVVLALAFTVASLVWILHQGKVGSNPGDFPKFTPGPYPVPVYDPRGAPDTVHTNGVITNLAPTVALAFRRRFPYSAFVIARGCVLISFNLPHGMSLRARVG